MVNKKKTDHINKQICKEFEAFMKRLGQIQKKHEKHKQEFARALDVNIVSFFLSLSNGDPQLAIDHGLRALAKVNYLRDKTSEFEKPAYFG